MLTCCIFSDTASTENYPYLHTLSLPDALPISWASARSPATLPSDRQKRSTAAAARLSSRSIARLQIALSPRSEEHTSELQSLMRNTYAVFCWKKKISNTSQTDIFMYLRLTTSMDN